MDNFPASHSLGCMIAPGADDAIRRWEI